LAFAEASSTVEAALKLLEYLLMGAVSPEALVK